MCLNRVSELFIFLQLHLEIRKTANKKSSNKVTPACSFAVSAIDKTIARASERSEDRTTGKGIEWQHNRIAEDSYRTCVDNTA